MLYFFESVKRNTLPNAQSEETVAVLNRAAVDKIQTTQYVTVIKYFRVVA